MNVQIGVGSIIINIYSSRLDPRFPGNYLSQQVSINVGFISIAHLAPDLEQIFLSESLSEQEYSQYLLAPLIFFFSTTETYLETLQFYQPVAVYAFRFLQRFNKDIEFLQHFAEIHQFY